MTKKLTITTSKSSVLGGGPLGSEGSEPHPTRSGCRWRKSKRRQQPAKFYDASRTEAIEAIEAIDLQHFGRFGHWANGSRLGIHDFCLLVCRPIDSSQGRRPWISAGQQIHGFKMP